MVSVYPQMILLQQDMIVLLLLLRVTTLIVVATKVIKMKVVQDIFAILLFDWCNYISEINVIYYIIYHRK